LGHGTLTDLSEGCPFVHGHVIGLVALDQILRRFFRGPDRVILKCDWESDLFLDRSAYAACFRVPAYMIPHFEFALHLSLPVLKTGVPTVDLGVLPAWLIYVRGIELSQASKPVEPTLAFLPGVSD
jgi:hypothetical protein